MPRLIHVKRFYGDTLLIQLIDTYGVDCNVTSYISWLVSLMPAVQDAVAVEGVGVGVDSPSETSQEHYYLARVVKLGPARTSKAMYLPSDLATKEKMVTCYAHPRRSWPFILEPTMGGKG
jgi:hypothetical protein